MEIHVGDKLVMKKNHPCGSNEFRVLRTGLDLRLHCCVCGREFLIPRAKIEKNIKRIVKNGE